MASPPVVGFVGLDELSLDLASSLIQSGFRVQAYQQASDDSDSSKAMRGFLDLGGVQCVSPKDAAKDATSIIIVTSADELENVICGEEGAAKGLHKDSVIILRSTLPPSHIYQLEKRLRDEVGGEILVDAHVFQGVSGALKENIIVVASGGQNAIQNARPVLSAVSEKVYFVEGEVGEASKIRMVVELLEGIHLVASVEAMFLGVRAGIHPSVLYEIISNAAGSSWIFVDTVPKLFTGDDILISSLYTLVNNLGFVMDVAKSLKFPLPLLSVAYQQLIFGSSSKCGEDARASPFKVWEQTFRVNIQEAANQKSYSPENLTDNVSSTSHIVKRIGFIGLGAMGFGMATHLLRSNFCVLAYDAVKRTVTGEPMTGGLIHGGFIAGNFNIKEFTKHYEKEAESVDSDKYQTVL